MKHLRHSHKCRLHSLIMEADMIVARWRELFETAYIVCELEW